MPYRMVLALVFSALVFGQTIQAANVTGTLLYDDHILETFFDDITSSSVSASPQAGGDSIDGTFDPNTSTVTFEGLAAGQWGLSIYLKRSNPPSSSVDAGDLWTYKNVTVENPGDSVTVDLDLLYVYHVTSPIDSNDELDGSGTDCTEFPIVPYPITFTIDPVPQAVAYEATVLRYSCPPQILDAQEWTLEDPNVEIEWGVSDEDYQEIFFTCTGASGKSLCSGGVTRYSDLGVWALLLRNGENVGRGRHHSDAFVIPAVAGTPGAHGTSWTTAATIVNPGNWDQTLTMTYTPRDTDGSESYSEIDVHLPAQSQIAWDNILAEVFSTTGAGALEIRGHDIAVTTRPSTPAEDDGTYGQGIPPIQPGQVLSADGRASATMGGVVESTAFRTNLGLCEFWGDPVTVRVTVFDDTMTEWGFRDFNLRPYENTQVNQVADAIGHLSNLAGGIVTVEVISGDGRVGAYLSVVDNETGDPTYVAIAPQAPAGG